MPEKENNQLDQWAGGDHRNGAGAETKTGSAASGSGDQRGWVCRKALLGAGVTQRFLPGS